MAIAGSVTVSESQGITYLNIDNRFATAKVSLFGGHVLSFTPKSDEVDRLWLSPHAYLNGERPIRGGIPVCWPWFSDDHGKEKGALPSHGFLRTQVWQLQRSEDTSVGTELVLSPSFTRADGFEYDCQVTLTIIIGESLSASLRTENTGVTPFTFNTALHTYLAVPSVQKVELEGLSGQYKDKLADWAVKDTPQPYKFTAETDRIHLNAPSTMTLKDNGEAFTQIGSDGHDSVVVWNPWQSAASISDMDAFGFVHMLCVETACTQGVALSPGESHTLTQIIGPPERSS
ncbi:D-hexose-6-phosphate mutarotase [Alteromonas sp. ASW11-19]|uniref:Putative glucose-6-phosphate 1-epimerase n=1 Tax=Alteromonas salexigens TaxID=2982530 RepID=A0ABT2VMQ8_9ALTE|nr:D-hexose-6-phosphate mutarotase [Alteromonas salexigens]MCU7554364.1 D-hexose-6-phosphate mutarotase [Alteromonas salexigens]